jgi:cyclopropane-fatty-acyl-phospholipid synthase
MFLENRLERMVGRLKEDDARDIPMRLKLWSGRTFDLGSRPNVTVTIPKPSALRYLVAPDLMKLGEAYVEGHIDVEGSLVDIFEAGEHLARRAAPASRLAGLRQVVTHSRRRDRKAIEYHYDVSNDFYRLFLGETMTYSCAYFATPETPLADAQRAKYDLICRKLGLRPGMRLLDVGCGWGGMAMHAAEHYGVQAVGVTLSQRQVEYARDAVAAAGLGDRVEIRLQDYRDVRDGPFDAISSIGMFEHVGKARLAEYFGRLHWLLRPGGRLLNHGICRPRGSHGLSRNGFAGRYVFPDGELHEVGIVAQAMHARGLEVRDTQSLREHYALTLRHWVRNLEQNWDEAVRLTSGGRARVWRLYMAGSAENFERGRTTVHQVLAVRPGADGSSALPLTREALLG